MLILKIYDNYDLLINTYKLMIEELITSNKDTLNLYKLDKENFIDINWKLNKIALFTKIILESNISQMPHALKWWEMTKHTFLTILLSTDPNSFLKDDWFKRYQAFEKQAERLHLMYMVRTKLLGFGYYNCKAFLILIPFLQSWGITRQGLTLFSIYINYLLFFISIAYIIEKYIHWKEYKRK